MTLQAVDEDHEAMAVVGQRRHGRIAAAEQGEADERKLRGVAANVGIDRQQ